MRYSQRTFGRIFASLRQTHNWRATSHLAVLLFCGIGAAQQPVSNSIAATDLPVAPLPKQQISSPQGGTPADEQQTKRVMGIMPNFRSVSAGEIPPPPTVREKFVTTSLDNFDYSALIFSGLIAANAMAGKATPEFHQGMAGYGRYYWHTLADQSVENYFVEFIIPAVNHEDSRYYAMGRRNGGFFKRTGYSLSRVVATRSDSGRPMFNYGEVAGSAMAVGVSTFYYPSPERTAEKGLRNWGLDVSYDALTFMFHEFWPDIHHGLFRGKDRSGNQVGEAEEPVR
jgi:hypothetical protein